MIISKPPLRIVATILAKDEEDIIGANIEHHVNQGVTHFIVTNNRSKDRTAEIASRYPEVVEVIDEPDDTHDQSKWVTRMARMACKLDPHWIVHLDADELWCGLSQLRHVQGAYVGSTKMFLHPPVGCAFDLHRMRHYLDFENVPGLPGECKVAHRPDPEVEITHGNHGFVGDKRVEFTKEIWRHHYPVRSCAQFIKKAVEGHEALLRRKSLCERWRKWYNAYFDGRLGILYDQICSSWARMIEEPSSEDLATLLEFWATQDVIDLFTHQRTLPQVGEWPRREHAQQGSID